MGPDLTDLVAPGGAAAMGLEKKSEPLPKEMWPSLPRATSFLGASSSTIALKANRLGAAPADQPTNRTTAPHKQESAAGISSHSRKGHKAGSAAAAEGKRELNGSLQRCHEYEGMQWRCGGGCSLAALSALGDAPIGTGGGASSGFWSKRLSSTCITDHLVAGLMLPKRAAAHEHPRSIGYVRLGG